MTAAHPILLVVLDGLGDRACSELGGATPLEAAATPNLDRLAAGGMNGLHLPFGWGRAPSSEVAHWSIFGYEAEPFCGRVVLEALGHGVAVPSGVPLFHAALRMSRERGGVTEVIGRAGVGDADDSRELFAALDGTRCDGVEFELLPLRAGEAVLIARGAGSADVSDSDPFVEEGPWLRPRPLADARDPHAAERSSTALFDFLCAARRVLAAHPVNVRRRSRNRAALDVLTTKWAGAHTPLPQFQDRVGLTGAAVTGSALYAGFAALFGWHYVRVPDSPDPAADVADRLAAAAGLLATHDFVYVHTKAPDEAGHRKDPAGKRDVLAAIDRAAGGLSAIAHDAVVVVTGDHATPSVGSMLHSGDPCPVLLAGPGVRPDGVQSFGESAAAAGVLGVLAARDLLPLAVNAAGRPRFLGAHLSPRSTPAWPVAEPMPTA